MDAVAISGRKRGRENDSAPLAVVADVLGRLAPAGPTASHRVLSSAAGSHAAGPNSSAAKIGLHDGSIRQFGRC